MQFSGLKSWNETCSDSFQRQRPCMYLTIHIVAIDKISSCVIILLKTNKPAFQLIKHLCSIRKKKKNKEKTNEGGVAIKSKHNIKLQ